MSRYFLEGDLKNYGNAPAFFLDVCAELSVYTKDKNLVETLGANSRRFNVLTNEISVDRRKLSILFTGDEVSKVLFALRELSANCLPRVHISFFYKNSSGGCFKAKHTYIIDVDEETEAAVREWHSKLIEAPIKFKEPIDMLKLRKASGSNPAWMSMFDNVRNEFKQSLANQEEKLKMKLVEISEQFVREIISEEDYNAEMKRHGYGKYVGKVPECTPKHLPVPKVMPEATQKAVGQGVS